MLVLGKAVVVQGQWSRTQTKNTKPDAIRPPPAGARFEARTKDDGAYLRVHRISSIDVLLECFVLGSHDLQLLLNNNFEQLMALQNAVMLTAEEESRVQYVVLNSVNAGI